MSDYKKFEDKFSEQGQKEFYSKMKKMKNHLENISNSETKKNIEKNISEIISSYENMKTYYFECLEHDKKIEELKEKNRDLAQKIFNGKIQYLKKTGFMYRDGFDEKFGLSNN
ncbi:MAG TPA: hypothetical protein VJ895_00165 [Candidatus Nanoarchaeia archaeon]|nr:hypothetical protein [Candidatus Nanoarchaeia archaeon]